MKILAVSDLFDNFLAIDIAPGVYSSLIVVFVVIVLAIIVGILARRQDPLKKPKGLLLLAEIGVNTFDGMVNEYMGPNFKGFGGYVLAIAVYLFLSLL